jgi:hypothetical protein
MSQVGDFPGVGPRNVPSHCKPGRRVNDALEFDFYQYSFGLGVKAAERMHEPRSCGDVSPYSRVPVTVDNLTGV